MLTTAGIALFATAVQPPGGALAAAGGASTTAGSGRCPGHQWRARPLTTHQPTTITRSTMRSCIHRPNQPRMPRPPCSLPGPGPARAPSPPGRLGLLAGELVEQGVGAGRGFHEPSRRLAAVPSHGLERGATHQVDELVRGVQLAHEAAGRPHRVLHRARHLPSADGTALQPDGELLAHRDADAVLGHPGAEQPGQLVAQRFLEGAHAAATTPRPRSPPWASTRNASPVTLTRAVPPSPSVPATIRRATGVSTSRWMARFSG